jgi:hypothetical protein
MGVEEMTDIDFDELDRAVNSAIGGGQPVADAAPAVVSTSTPVSVTVSTPKPQINVPERRSSSGKFMDVVPPSASTKVNISAPEVVSREAVTVSPTTEIVEDAQPSVTPAEPTPAPGAGVPEEDSPQNPWPDPIDFQAPNETVEEQKPTENIDSEDADIDKISDDINKTLEASTAPLDTPFLADAKVEKRPLGAFSSGSESPVVAPENNEVKTDVDLETENPANIGMPEMPELPEVPSEAPEEAALPELEGAEQPEESSAVIEEPVEQAAVETPAPIDSTPAPTPAPATPAAAPIEQPTGPTSITQQYHEQPSTTNQTSGAIYDTDAYHKALKPVKKQSGWWMVLWIFLLLAIGAGAGAAAYFFILPNLGL